MRATTYEQVSSFLLALSGGLVLIATGVGATWFAIQRPVRNPPVAIELIEDPGGEEDGAVDETLRVEAPGEEERPDASTADVEADTVAVAESLDNIIELADKAVEQQPQKQFDSAPESTGKKGKASGTGRRALGKGGGKSGFPREQRWYIQYPDRQPLDEYAQLLDYYRIEIGVLLAGKIVYVSNLSAATPTKRESTSGGDEKRLYMTWQGGGRRLADLQLLRKAGVEAGTGTLFHFYPADVERELALLEFNHAQRKADQIRRTYFQVKSGPGRGQYEIEVSRQTALR